MLEVTREQIEEFILSQPNRRPIEFRNIYNSSGSIGCLMIQYSREKGFITQETCCGMTIWMDIRGKGRNGVRFTIAEAEGWDAHSYGKHHKTYKTLKEAVIKLRQDKDFVPRYRKNYAK